MRRQLEGLTALRALKLEGRRVHTEGELQRLQSRVHRERLELSEELSHAGWMAAQKRLVREAHVRRALANALGSADIASAMTGSSDGVGGGGGAAAGEGADEGGVPLKRAGASAQGGGGLVSDAAAEAAEAAAADAAAVAAADAAEAAAAEAAAAAAEEEERKAGAAAAAAAPPRPPADPPAEAPGPAEAAAEAHFRTLIRGPQPPLPYSWAPLPAYNQSQGLYILFDFLAGLPSKAKRVQLAFCFYVGAEQFGPVQAFGPLDTELDPNMEKGEGSSEGGDGGGGDGASGGGARGAEGGDAGGAAAGGGAGRLWAPIGMNRMIDGEGGDDVTLVVEVQREAPTGGQKSVGWCALPLFRGHESPAAAAAARGGGAGPAAVGESPEVVAKPSLTSNGFSVDPATGETVYTPFGRILRLPLLKPPVDVRALTLEGQRKSTALTGGAAVYLRLVTHAEHAATASFIMRAKAALDGALTAAGGEGGGGGGGGGGAGAGKPALDAAAAASGIPRAQLKAAAAVLASTVYTGTGEDADQPQEVFAAFRPNPAHRASYITHSSLPANGCADTPQVPLGVAPMHETAGPYEHPMIAAGEAARRDRLARQEAARASGVEAHKRALEAHAAGVASAAAAAAAAAAKKVELRAAAQAAAARAAASSASALAAAAAAPPPPTGAITRSYRIPRPARPAAPGAELVPPPPLLRQPGAATTQLWAAPLEPFAGLEVDSLALELGPAASTSAGGTRPLLARLSVTVDGLLAAAPGSGGGGDGKGSGGLAAVGLAAAAGSVTAAGFAQQQASPSPGYSPLRPSQQQSASRMSAAVSSLLGPLARQSYLSGGSALPQSQLQMLPPMSLQQQLLQQQQQQGGAPQPLAPGTPVAMLTATTLPVEPRPSQPSRYTWGGMQGPFAPLLSAGLLAPGAPLLLASFSPLPLHLHRPLGPFHLSSCALVAEFMPDTLPAALRAPPPQRPPRRVCLRHARKRAAERAAVPCCGRGGGLARRGGCHHGARGAAHPPLCAAAAAVGGAAAAGRRGFRGLREQAAAARRRDAHAASAVRRQRAAAAVDCPHHRAGARKD